MAQIVKSCDYPDYIAVTVFEMLNDGIVEGEMNIHGEYVIVTDTEPKNLNYPEGWYYAKGRFRNKHKSTTGLYYEVEMFTKKGKMWRDIADYCTLNE